MKHNFPRCNLPKARNRSGVDTLTVPPHVAAIHPCYTCGETSAYCTHKRKDHRYICENCYRKSNPVQITKRKQWLWEHKASEGCVLCDENDPICLDYHHTNPRKKKFSIGSISSSIPDQAIVIEMKKCVVICANCHRKVEVAHKK